MNVTWAWWLNVIGLGTNFVAAVLMCFYPPRVAQFTAKGEGFVTFVSGATEEGKRKGVRQQYLSRSAIGLLGLGFFLQLIAAFLSG
jgi:hypothetical protein